MTNIVNKNTINIKIHDKKKTKKRKYKKRNAVSTHQNAPYNNIAVGTFNRAQEFNPSTAVGRENDAIVNSVITAVKRDNDILALYESKKPQKIEPKAIKNTPEKKRPKLVVRAIKNKPDIETVKLFPDKPIEPVDRFEIVGETMHGKKGRKETHLLPGESVEGQIKRLKKNEANRLRALSFHSPVNNRIQVLEAKIKNNNTIPKPRLKPDSANILVTPIKSNDQSTPIALKTRAQKKINEAKNPTDDDVAFLGL